MQAVAEAALGRLSVREGLHAATATSVVVGDACAADAIVARNGPRVVGSYAVAPLVLGERVSGVMYAGVPPQRRWDPDDEQLLQLFADSVAVAIGQTRAHAAEREARTAAGIVESAVGRVVVDTARSGTTFTLDLAAASEPVDDGGSAPTTILVAEDDPALRMLIRIALQRDRFRVIEAQDGRDALELAEQYGAPIDLLLTDVEIGSPNGPELAARLGLLRPHARVVYMSGSPYCDLIADDAFFLVKPFELEQLSATVRAALAAAEPAR